MSVSSWHDLSFTGVHQFREPVYYLAPARPNIFFLLFLRWRHTISLARPLSSNPFFPICRESRTTWALFYQWWEVIERVSLIPGRVWDVTSPFVSTWPPYWRVSARLVESSGGKLYRESHVCVSMVPYTLHRQIPALSRLSYFGRLPISGHGNHISSKF